MNELVAIVDDEPDILELVSLHLKKAGYRVKEFENARDFLKFLEKTQPDLLVLDLMLPDIDGLDVCKHMKREQKLAPVPIIMLSAKGEEIDRVLGLELGADDYITKPFSPKELVARVKTVLRRKDNSENKGKKLTAGDLLTIDEDKYEVLAEGKKVELTTTEFRILALLVSRPGYVLTRDRMLDYLWGDEKIVLDRTVDVHIRNLRKKLGKAGQLIKNVRGIGYKLQL